MTGPEFKVWRWSQQWQLPSAKDYFAVDNATLWRWEQHGPPPPIEILAYLLTDEDNKRRVEDYLHVHPDVKPRSRPQKKSAPVIVGR